MFHGQYLRNTTDQRHQNLLFYCQLYGTEKQAILLGPWVRTGGFCWCKVLLPACPCWQEPAHSD